MRIPRAFPEAAMILTLELKLAATPEHSEIALCFDEEGLDLLIKKLSALKGVHDHEHMRTPAWAGAELTEIGQAGSDYVLLNHLRLVKRS